MPVLVSYQGVEMHRAVATSWFIVAVVSASATIGHFAAGQRVPFAATLLFVTGGIAGFEIGSRAGQRLSSARLTRLFAAVIFALSILMLGEIVAA